MSNPVISCPGCGAYIGEVVKGGDNVSRLRISTENLTIDLEGRGNVTCLRCGKVKEWYWDGYAIDHLIGRVRSVLRDSLGT